MEEDKQTNVGEGKRPMWQWVIIIAVLILTFCMLVYFFIADNNKSKSDALKYSAQLETIKKNMIDNNNLNKNKMETPSTNFDIQGMKVEILKAGTGAEAKNGDNVTVNYTGTLENGTKFDSSLNAGRSPFEFKLGQNMVIKGWELGVLGMKVGEKRKLTIPSDLGYGSAGAGGVIPPNATLIFEVDLLKIN